LKSHRDEYTKLSFPVAHLVVKLGVILSRSRLLTRSHSPLHSPPLSLG
jgi:hypothetical protein